MGLSLGKTHHGVQRADLLSWKVAATRWGEVVHPDSLLTRCRSTLRCTAGWRWFEGFLGTCGRTLCKE